MSAHTLTDEEAQEIIDTGVATWELMRLAEPGLSMEECDYLLWETTPYPVVRGVHDIVDRIAHQFTRHGGWDLQRA